MTDSAFRAPRLLQQGLQRLMTKPSLIVSVLVTAVFSVRWINCLPFSGFSPALDNVDTLGFMGRFLIFAQEPFQFPLGTIHGLSFPFESAHISRGAIPLFALFFKAVGRFYPPFLEFNYLVLAELIAVFVTAFLTCRLLSLLSIKGWWFQLLGACFVALSPALLYRSSSYYGETFVVLYFPLMLMAAYSFIRLFVSPEKWRYRLAFCLVFPLIALVDLYLLFAAFVLVGTAVLAVGGYALSAGGGEARQRIGVVSATLFAGVVLSWASLWILGNQSNFETPPRSVLFANRDGAGWGYGGGFGGGFHVADVFSVFIANPDGDSSSAKRSPGSLARSMNLPLANTRPQAGQYEGFAFVGSIPLLLLVISTGAWLWAGLRTGGIPRPRSALWKEKISVGLRNPLILSAAAVALGCFWLYALSWGYILHMFGHRFNDVLTPSALLAFVYPKFMYARSLGRLAIPFSMMTSVVALFMSYRFLTGPEPAGRWRRWLVPLLSLILIAAHLADVADYLRPPERVFAGNEIARTFSDEDVVTLKRAANSKVAVMLVPELLSSVPWNQIGFSIAYHTRLPISGATLGFAERSSELQQYAADGRAILNGEIGEITSRYGPIVVAAPGSYARSILARTDVPLASIELKSQDVVLLIPQGKRP